MIPKIIFNCILSYILALYSDEQYPIKVVQQFFDFMINFLRRIFMPSLKQEILSILRNENTSAAGIKKVEVCIDI